MSEILFVSPYPTKQRLNEGFIQRVNEIDILFSSSKRTYLDIRFKSNFKRKVISKNNTEIYHLNWLLHFKTIIKLLKQHTRIFIHSIYSGFRIFPYILFAKTKQTKVCLDSHGAFQEELKYKGEKFTPTLYGFIEKLILKKSDFVIFVSKPHENYFLNKYPFLDYAKRYVIPTCSSKVFKNYDETKNETIKSRYQIKENDVVFVYSGSTEVWQKIDLMMSLIKKLIRNNSNYKFFLLTANVQIMLQKAKSNNIYPNENINILHVPTEELGNYYNISHYGFVLRDEHILNEVASPTKLLEYLYFGITPILKSTKLGNFTNYKIDYLTINDLNYSLPAQKSTKNIEIANQILRNYNTQLQKLKNDLLA